VSIASPNLPQTGRSVAASQGAASSSDASAAAPTVAASRVIADTLPPSRENFFQRGVSALFGRRAFWIAFMIVAFSWPLVRVAGMVLPAKLPVLGTIAPFELVDQTGHRFGTKELAGRVWVVSAVRTRSPWADDLTKLLVKIQHRARNLGPAFHIVTVGIDAESDTPEALLDFTGRYRVSPRIWSFVSGDAAELRNAQTALGVEPRGAVREFDVAPSAPRGAPAVVASRGASAPSAVASPGLDAPSDLAMGPLSVAVVDGKMRVRGRYDLADPKATDALLYHVGLLVNRGD
jgi:cytochrome oxidase Cu insertion factor (SCO1/SenC/PrrC family)